MTNDKRVVSVKAVLAAIYEIADRSLSPDIEADAGVLEAVATALDAFGPFEQPLTDAADRIREIAKRMMNY